MESKVNLPLVGAFVLGLAAVLIGGALWLASGGAYQTHYDIYQAAVEESVAGLNLNAPVKYNGVDVGKVHAIALEAGNPQHVNLLFAIERGTPIKQDTVATLKTQGLTGIAYVELSGGAKASPPLLATPGSRYPEIQTKPSLSTRLENVLTDVLAKLDNTSTTLNAILSDDNREAFSSMLRDGAALAHTLAARKDALDAVITQTRRTLDGTAAAAPGLAPLIERIGQSADAVGKMGEAVALTSAGASKTVQAVGTDMQRLGSQTLPEIERLMTELNLLAISLRRLSDQTGRDPAALLFGRTPVPDGPGESKGPP